MPNTILQDYRGEFPLVDPSTGRASSEFLRFLQERGGNVTDLDTAVETAQSTADQAQTEVDALEAVVANLEINDLVDVDTVTTAPVDGDLLTWVAANSRWEPLAPTASTTATWGSITGTLSDQTDLQTALDGKANTSHTHVTADITDLASYTGFDARYYTEAEVDALVGTDIAVWVADTPTYTGIDTLNFLSDSYTLSISGGNILNIEIDAVEEAPNDGTQYVRQNGSWVANSAGLSKFPLVDGSVPPNLVYEEDGSLVYVEI